MTGRLFSLVFLLTYSATLCAQGPAPTRAKSAGPASDTSSKSDAPDTKPSPVAEALGRRLLSSTIPLHEVYDHIGSRILPMPEPRSVAEWERYADHARRETLDRVVFRGEAARWRALRTRVEWFETIDGGPGYKIKKLRYEAVPGLWIPALLYEPTAFKTGKVPVSLAVNGHDRPGKAAGYKQLRCINQAKRGMIVLSTEFLAFGQLNGPNYDHYRMNQLDLCGTSGLAPFYLVLSRGLDILLAQQHADPARVAVQGLSGGAWQTITISALDTRVTLANPVAGYADLRSQLRYVSDLGDSEENPSDMETVVDYVRLTAMLAPRPALLTYNFADRCCWKGDHALPPLAAAARPIYELYGKPNNFRTHVNLDPGTHNFGLDNRQQFYAILKDFFFTDRPDVTAAEIPSESELKTADQLKVPLPEHNADFNSLARGLTAALPRDATIPSNPDDVGRWQNERRALLRETVRARSFDIAAVMVGVRRNGPWTETDYWLRLGGAWTVPAVELAPAQPQGDAIVLADGGRPAASGAVEELLRKGQRVLAVDLLSFGESKIAHQCDVLLMVSYVGDRPLGIQASQLAAIARWVRAKRARAPRILAVGPRSSLIAVVAAGLEANAIGGLELEHAFGSLKEIVEQNMTVEQAPELFCFGLLERFDMPQLVGLVAPRPVRFGESSQRVESQRNRSHPAKQ